MSHALEEAFDFALDELKNLTGAVIEVSMIVSGQLAMKLMKRIGLLCNNKDSTHYFKEV